MRRAQRCWPLVGLLILCPVAKGQYPPSSANAPAKIYVTLPPNAVLYFDGARTKSTGPVRAYLTPTLTAGKRYSYEIKVMLPGGKGGIDAPPGDPTDPGPVPPVSNDLPPGDPTDRGPVPPPGGKPVDQGPPGDPTDPGPVAPVPEPSATGGSVAVKKVYVWAGRVSRVEFTAKDFQK